MEICEYTSLWFRAYIKARENSEKRICYIEFTTQNAVEEALSMNGFDLGGQFLRVGRSITPPDALTFSAPAGPSSLPTASALAAAAVTAKIQA
uniref:RRM domain-containing protein n=1 Tax=Acrobeloides nanus TaxID=290746 RepID=A0A914DUC3_9BILA